MFATTNAPSAASAAAAAYRPCIINTSDAGTHTSALPNIGSTDAPAAEPPHSRGCGRSKAQHARPTRVPCATPVATTPSSIASVVR